MLKKMSTTHRYCVQKWWWLHHAVGLPCFHQGQEGRSEGRCCRKNPLEAAKDLGRGAPSIRMMTLKLEFCIQSGPVKV